MGNLIDPVEGVPVHRGQVVVTWTTQGSPTDDFSQVRQTTRSDRSGRFVLCGLPSHERIVLQLRHDDFEIEHTVVEFGADTVRVRLQGIENDFPVPEHIWRLELPLRVRP